VSDYVREIGTVTDEDGRKVVIGVDFTDVTVSNCGRFGDEKAEEFVRLLTEAREQAARNKRQMDADGRWR